MDQMAVIRYCTVLSLGLFFVFFTCPTSCLLTLASPCLAMNMKQGICFKVDQRHEHVLLDGKFDDISEPAGHLQKCRSVWWCGSGCCRNLALHFGPLSTVRLRGVFVWPLGSDFDRQIDTIIYLIIYLSRIIYLFIFIFLFIYIQMRVNYLSILICIGDRSSQHTILHPCARYLRVGTSWMGMQLVNECHLGSLV